MGGATLLIIISSLFVVIVCIRRFCDKKSSHSFDNRTEIELHSNIKMNTNPSYSVTEPNTNQDDQYEYVSYNGFSLQDDKQNTMKMDYNPSYRRVHGCNAVNYNAAKTGFDGAIQPNPSYRSISKESAKAFEGGAQNCYVEMNQRAGYHKVIGSTTKEKSIYDNDTDNTDYVKVNCNPSHDSDSKGIKLEDNPSYNKHASGQHP